MKWWEIIPDAPCVFAIDSESKVDKDKVYFTNAPNRFLTYINGKSKANMGYTSGYIFTNLEFEKPLKTYRYKSLNIFDTPLLFDTPIQLPDEFTFILKVKVNQSTIFLSNNGPNYGLVLGTDWSYSAKYWHISGYDTKGSYQDSQFDRVSKISLQTVVLKGNLNTRQSQINTDYGLYKIPSESSVYTGTNFLVKRSYTTLGYYHSTSYPQWYINSDIVAYGLFAKNMTDEEVSQVLSTIEDQFLVKESLVTFEQPSNLETSSQVFKNLKFQDPEYLVVPLQAGKPELPLPSKMVLRIFEEAKFIRNLYKKYETIEDHVYEEGEPVQTKLFLYEKATGQLVKTTISDKKGYFVFYNLNEDQEYIVSAIDPKYQFKSISKDYNN